jgi:hypothetical protein
VQDSSPEPQQSIVDTNETGHHPVNMTATVAFSPLPTPMDDFPTASHIIMTPRGPPQEQVISPELSTGNEQMAIDYGGMIWVHFLLDQQFLTIADSVTYRP